MLVGMVWLARLVRSPPDLEIVWQEKEEVNSLSGADSANEREEQQEKILNMFGNFSF